MEPISSSLKRSIDPPTLPVGVETIINEVAQGPLCQRAMGAVSACAAAPDLETGGAEADASLAQQRSNALLVALKSILQVCADAPLEVQKSFDSSYRPWLTHSSEAIFMKRAKYLLTAPFARYLRNPEPPAPDELPKLGRQWRLWMKSRMRTVNRRDTHLWYSFLQGKRGAMRVSDELVETTYAKHRAQMLVDDPADEVLVESLVARIDPVLRDVRREIRQCHKELLSSEVRHHASTSACFEASRLQGGARGFLAAFSDMRYPRLDLVRMEFYARVEVDGVVHTNVVLEQYDDLELRDRWHEAIWRGLSWRSSEPYLRCTIQAVLEPLKVRVISKGPALEYYYSKPMQRQIHGAMRRMACFRLIGRPLDVTDLHDLVTSQCRSAEGESPHWISVDYSAATDGLSARLSARILERLTVGLPEAKRRIWAAVLAPHHCRYPFPSSVEPVMQRNGQLMGSILSFPVLCLANLAVYLETVARLGDTRTLWEKLHGVLINGDDMLYVAPERAFSVHSTVSKSVGLEMSAGKAYVHPVVANVNSACYHCDLSKPACNPAPVPYFNVGLFQNTSKVLNKINDSPLLGEEDGMDGDGLASRSNHVVAIIPELLRGARSQAEACKILRMYLGRHHEEIEESCLGRQLFLPIPLGGMGIRPPDGFHYTLTFGQKRWASWLIETRRLRGLTQPVEERHRTIPPPRSWQPIKFPWLPVEPLDVEPPRLRRVRKSYPISPWLLGGRSRLWSVVWTVDPEYSVTSPPVDSHRSTSPFQGSPCWDPVDWQTMDEALLLAGEEMDAEWTKVQQQMLVPLEGLTVVESYSQSMARGLASAIDSAGPMDFSVLVEREVHSSTCDGSCYFGGSCRSD